jgi:nicotinamide-nucleotide amidase
LQTYFIENKITLALAESCTGGRIAAQLTTIAGASQYFLGSLVVYADQLKRDLLHVPEHLLKTQGAVSKEVVGAMLDGLFQVTPADYGVAVSGIAGPTGGSPDKPVGTIWAAIGRRGQLSQIFTFRAEGVREEIILFTVNYVLKRLLESLY